jgi:hypothetical protein
MHLAREFVRSREGLPMILGFLLLLVYLAIDEIVLEFRGIWEDILTVRQDWV